ncbi:MAG: hypothetical protein NUV67_04045 [archaeon]|nr:hypothetical protein [archaeon]
MADDLRAAEDVYRGLKREGKVSRPLAKINDIHEVDFAEVVGRLQQRFPGERIRVLNEGNGKSLFASGLVSVAKGVDLDFIKTDIAHSAQFDVLASPEELVSKFGRDSFHLVVSTFGGASYTNANAAKAIMNVAEVLKPGGVAYIAIPYFRMDKELVRLAKNFRNIRIHRYDAGNSTAKFLIRKM